MLWKQVILSVEVVYTEITGQETVQGPEVMQMD